MFPSFIILYYYLWDEKKTSLEQSLIMRTFSVSTTIPEEEEDDDVFSGVDSEVEYDLQLKPNAKHDLTGNAAMEVVAVARNATVNDISGDVESSVVVFVNSSIA